MNHLNKTVRRFSTYLPLGSLFLLVFLQSFGALASKEVPKQSESNEARETRFFLKTKIVVSSNSLRLCDLVRCKGDFDLEILPLVSEPFFITPERAKSLIQSAFSQKSMDPSNVEVQGIGGWVIPLTEQSPKLALVESLAELISQETGTPKEDFKIQLETNSEKFPDPKVKFQFRKIGKEIRAGKRIFPLDFYVKDEKIHSIPLSFLVETKKEAFFTNKEIPAKQILDSNDIERRSFFDSESGSDYVTDSPLGKTALNDLSKGKPILKKQIRLLHTIERGQEVQLIVALETILVKARGRALESGGEGSVIRVMNLTSSRILQAEVKGPGLCEVKI